MPDKRRHRGPHPEDARLFALASLPSLRDAVSDLSFLLSRGYAEKSGIKLVGDRYQLRERQRTAVLRSSCSDAARRARRARRGKAGDVAGASLSIDGYNLLITVESALAGGVVLHGRDGCYRDLASMHGSYRLVEETLPALTLIGEVLERLAPHAVNWYFDSPVSNSGRLARKLRDLAAERGWPWSAELVRDPDAVLIAASGVIASTDSRVLDGCRRWVHLAREIISRKVAGAWILELGRESEREG